MAPAGQRLRDGFASLITFAGAPTISLWEREVTPPGVDGGGPNDVTNMRSTAWRSKLPKKLKSADDITVTAQYGPQVYNDIIAQCNVNQLITVTFSDLAQVKVWGWLNTFKPNPMREGEAPDAVVTIHCSNLDASQAEVAPLYIGPPS